METRRTQRNTWEWSSRDISGRASFSFLFLLLQGKKELEVKIASLNNVRLYCKQQGQRSSSHPFRLDLVLHCTTWLAPGTALNTCIDRRLLHLTVRSNLSVTICCHGQGRELASSRPNSWTQFIGNNMDHQVRTLDDAGTFHGMGIQNTGWGWNIPWDWHSKHWMVLGHSIGWALSVRPLLAQNITKPYDEKSLQHKRQCHAPWAIFICYFDASVVDLSLAYEAVLQNFTSEDKSKILYIPWKAGPGWCRMCATGYILVRVLSFPTHDRSGRNQHELHISTLISGTTLWSHTSSHLCTGKPRRSLTMSHLTVSHGPSSYGLGDFTQKWAFLSARDDWRQDRAFNNCWKWSLLRILSHTCWLARPSPEQFEDIFLQMLSLMLNSIERE